MSGLEPTSVEEICEFRDMPSTGWTPSRTTETSTTVDDGGNIGIEVSGGPTLLDDPGDFTLEIDVPDKVALEREAREDRPLGWPFREFWLTADQANRYRDTLVVYDSNDGEEVPLDLVGR